MNKFATTYAARAVCLVIAASVLSGCQSMDDSRRRAEKVHETATKYRDDNLAGVATAGVQRTKRSRISGDEVVLRTLNALPDKFATTVSYATHGAQGFNEVLEDVSARVGMSITGAEIMQTQSTQGQGGSMAGMAQQFMPGNATGGAGSGKLGGIVQLEYNGTLRGLLDELAARKEASWRYNARTNSVTFFRFETRTLSVHLPPGAKNIAASISLSGVGGSGGGGGGGGSGGGGGGASGGSGGGNAGNVSVSQNQVIDPWSSIMNGVQSILAASGPARTQTGAVGGGGMTGGAGMGMGGAGGGGGMGQGMGGQMGRLMASGADGQASASPELGMVTVTARPQAVERIAAYLDSINARFAQNVMIDMKVLNVSLNDDTSAGFSLDMLYRKLNGNGISIVGGSPLQPAAGTPGRISLFNGNANSAWNGSALVAEALSQYGSVSVKTQGQVLAINGQPAPFQQAEEVTYLASSATTTAANVGVTTTLTPDSRIVGFTANLTPLILGDNRILLTYQMEISRIELTQQSDGNSRITTPRISKQSLQNQAFVRDSEVIVLFSFDQNRDTVDTRFSTSGASRTGHSERSMTVIVMQVSGGRRNG